MRIGASGEVGQPGSAFGEAGQHGIAVRDGLVAGNSERTLQRPGRADNLNVTCDDIYLLVVICADTKLRARKTTTVSSSKWSVPA